MRFFVCAADEGIRVKASATTSFYSTECRSGELRVLHFRFYGQLRQ